MKYLFHFTIRCACPVCGLRVNLQGECVNHGDDSFFKSLGHQLAQAEKELGKKMCPKCKHTKVESLAWDEPHGMRQDEA